MELSDQAPSYSPSAGKTCASVAIAADRANSGRNVGTARKARRRKKSTTTPSTSSSPSSPKPWRAALAVLSFGAIVPNRQISPSVELGSSSSAARGRCRRRPAVAVQALSITTFNVLAAVHRSVPAPPGQPQVERRESERKDWWQPRAEGLAKFVADELAFSDAVLLQEWWFGTEFEEIFDYHTGGIFDRVAEQRPGPGGTLREDGMAVLVKRKGKLELMGSDKVRTGPQRIAQIVKCRERGRGDRGGRPVLLGNTHLSFPGDPDRITNERRQAFEVQLVARAISRAGRRLSSDGDCEGHMQIIGGDFNSDVCSLASAKLESRHDFVNCMSAYSEQNLCSIGGRVNIGVTHRTHRGEDLSVDQIFCRLMTASGDVSKTSLRRLGGPTGTYVVDCRKRLMRIEGEEILSDHMPVTATLNWPSGERNQEEGYTFIRNGFYNETLHPLQSPWDS
mmetsp:Transcript_31113/g.66237  ORF Transcript_31113/g.66237 Transcript_31113/m.66237 type:complete len:451 (+) Transcript_31113:40-1392(+)